ncbi:adenylyltransferase and sulfurtransferase [Lishizhenia tianjinensis]|uniref:Molybdopterin-synthase adenylyltransferase n=1 Tax=Lishizhenia tianjinensis TaxID=477690 RepID=A0A1I7BQY4_9FLAO|nr:ThiF family adenylyltransferase [Lishizhenia tianjinensis]SFT89551.1 adenylyltransferase and sulfurtransferase [Lishizhenia tianjinensis]
MLTEKEKVRYNRHLILQGFGEEAQLKLKEARVLVVGAGGLGSPLLSYLCAAGVGNIGIVDFDTVDVSNLQRQTLYKVEDVGSKKTRAAVEHLKAQNPYVNFEVFDLSLQADNIFEVIEDYDIVVDGTDNFPTRYLINDACVLKDKVNVHASINEFTGQLSVFNFLKKDGSRSANYRDIYPQPPAAGEVKSCSEAGVIGVLPGIMGSMQALEVVKVITGIGEVLCEKMMFYNGLTQETFNLSFQKDENNPLTRKENKQTTLIDYHEFCGVQNLNGMKSINVQELKQWQAANENFTLIDVREQYEYDQANMDAQLIPMNEVPNNVEAFKKEGKVVVHCRSGARSANVIAYLEQNHGLENLYNLEGGILAWLDAQ